MKKIFGLLKNFLIEYKKEIIAITILATTGYVAAKYIIKHHPQQANLALMITMPIALAAFAILLVSLWENIRPHIFYFLKKIMGFH